MLSRLHHFLPTVSLCVFAIVLQIHTTLYKEPGIYSGLRLALSDLLLPFIGLGIAWSLIRRRTLWPRWESKAPLLWISALTGVLLLACVHTYFLYGAFDHWALTNKITGWFTLIAYFLLAAWIATNAQRTNINRFFHVFFWFVFITAMYQLGLLLYRDMFLTSSSAYRYIEGFTTNRNAFSLIFLISCAWFYCQKTGHKSVLQKTSVFIFWFFVPLIFSYIASRAALALAVIALCAIIIHSVFERQARATLLSILCGILFICAAFAPSPERFPVIQSSQTKSFALIDNLANLEPSFEKKRDIPYVGDNIRLMVLNVAGPMITERPWLGSGLGSVRIEQTKEYDHIYDIADSTPLWLIAETGIIGFSVFAGFGFFILIYCWRRTRDGPEDDQAFYRFMVAALIIFAAMSVFHEILYTRFAWVLLGIALCLPFNKHRAQSASPAA